MSNVKLYPYKMGSHSGKALAQALGVSRIRENGMFRHRPHRHTIINWGNPRQGRLVNDLGVINLPRRVAVAGNKLEAFNAMAGVVNIPRYTTSRIEAQEWLEEGTTIVCRALLRGSGGRGITLVRPDGDLPDVPLYVQYIPKRDEYRVHVFDGQVIDSAKKMVRAGSEGNNWQIRNGANGWIFGRNEVEVPQCVIEEATKAVSTLDLDFGAVDVGYTLLHRQATVYEVNTAPGIEGTTLARYTQAIQSFIGEE